MVYHFSVFGVTVTFETSAIKLEGKFAGKMRKRALLPATPCVTRCLLLILGDKRWVQVAGERECLIVYFRL